jgi:Putative zinc-finger
MDHDEAVRLQAAVKYVLGELPQVERDSFEEHYFDCGECALDVRASAAFADNARNVLCQEARDAALQAAAPAGRRWLAWLKPVVAVPAFAVLLMALGYQSFVSVPHWKTAAMRASASRVLPMYSLVSANTRGPNSQAIRLRAGEPFGLYVDVPVDSAYARYALKVEDPDGKTTILRTITYSEAQKTVVVEVTPKKSGRYNMVVLALTEQLADPARAPVLATMKFDVELGT